MHFYIIKIIQVLACDAMILEVRHQVFEVAHKCAEEAKCKLRQSCIAENDSSTDDNRCHF